MTVAVYQHAPVSNQGQMHQDTAHTPTKCYSFLNGDVGCLGVAQNCIYIIDKLVSGWPGVAHMWRPGDKVGN